MDENGKNKGNLGRPSSYNESYAKRAEELASEGCTNVEIYKALRISETTFYRWCADIKEFKEAIENGKPVSIPKIVEAVNKAAIGYTEVVKREKTKLIYKFSKDGEEVPYEKIVESWDQHIVVPPSVQAAKFMLTNRAKDQWKLNPDNFDESGDRIPDVNLNIGTQVLQGAQLATSEQEAEDLAPDLDEMHEDLLKDEEE